MSGGFGWDGRSHRPSNTYTSTVTPSPTGRAHTPTPIHNIPPPPKRSYGAAPVLGAALDVTAKNLLMVGVDLTGSMKEWTNEILKRLSTLYQASTQFVGDDLEVVFMGFGDPGYCHIDNLIVPGVGRGPTLSNHLDVLRSFPQSGGGNERENAEMVFLTADRMIQPGNFRNAFLFVITDEMAYDTIDPATAFRLGIPDAAPERTSDLVRRLDLKFHTFCIFADTQSYGPKHQTTFLPWWKGILQDDVIPLDDSRRVVDVMLGAMAKTVNQYEAFSSMLQSFQGGTTHGEANIRTVHQSLSMVGSKAPKSPVKKTSKGLMGE